MMITGKDSVGRKLGCLWKIGTWQLRSCSKGRRYSRREEEEEIEGEEKEAVVYIHHRTTWTYE